MTRFHVAPRALFVALGLSLALSGFAPASAEAPTGEPVDGIKCEQSEGAVFHIHQHLSLYDHGKPMDVPTGIGLAPVSQCLYWMHTHSADGIVHVESSVFRDFTLGNFFDIWGQPLSATAVASARVKKGQVHAWVDGRPYAGDVRAIPMTLHADIVLEAGPPYRKPTPFTDWQGN